MSFLYSQLFVTPAYPTASFSGQTVIVTGSNVGLGKEAARHFTRLGASKVILAVRNLDAGAQAKADIEKSEQRPGVCEVWKLDLGDYTSVKAFATRAAQLPRLDILVENAGIATPTFKLVEGHESSVTINVISTFLLALLLLPKLRETGKKFPTSLPHLIVVSSEVHGWTKFPEGNAPNIFAALSDKSKADMGERYPTSKLLEVLAIRTLAPKIAGTGVVLNFLNPGLCHSELGREAGWGLWAMKQALARSTEVGSRTLVAAASLGVESHGAYIHDGAVGDAYLSPFVRSEAGHRASERVWDELSGILEKIEPGVTSPVTAF